GGTTDVEVTGLTIADGSAAGTTMMGPLGPATLGGGILNNGGNLIVFHVTLSDNQVVGFNSAGGAIANVFGATLTVDHSTFTDNVAHGGKGANGGPAQNGRNGGNGGGGAIANLNDSFLVAAAGSTLIIEHTAFTSNRCIGGAGGGGGGGAGGAGGNGLGG